jgi:hypothetical protein
MMVWQFSPHVTLPLLPVEELLVWAAANTSEVKARRTERMMEERMVPKMKWIWCSLSRKKVKQWKNAALKWTQVKGSGRR